MEEDSLLPEDPPDEPPSGSTAELFWRVAVRLFRDHSTNGAESAVAAAPAPHRCGRCRQPWPCSGRRLAVLGLLAAARPLETADPELSRVTLGAPCGTTPGCRCRSG